MMILMNEDICAKDTWGLLNLHVGYVSNAISNTVKGHADANLASAERNRIWNQVWDNARNETN